MCDLQQPTLSVEASIFPSIKRVQNINFDIKTINEHIHFKALSIISAIEEGLNIR